jgi:hypothetical protein
MIVETIGAFATLASVLQTWKIGARGKKERKLQALGQLSNAVTVTQRALKTRRNKRRSDPDLVNAWRQASFALESAGENKLARFCNVKSLYWLDPDAWTREEVRAAGIQLQAIEHELRRLMQA